MSFRVHGKDLLTVSELSRLCRSATELKITTDQLGNLFLSLPVDDDLLRAELEQIQRDSSDDLARAAAEVALDAWS